MTYAKLDSRVEKRETRVDEIEEGYGATLLAQKRDIHDLKVVNSLLVAGVNRLGEGMAVMMERLGVEPITLPIITLPTREQLDEAFDENC